MSDSNQVNNLYETQARWRYHYIHNVYGSFFSDVLDYFGNYLYPRFQYQVVGTYDKAVEYIKNCQQYNREVDQPMLPALILNPTGDFDVADGNAGGKQLWRFPNLAYGFNRRWVIPVYKDENMMVSVAFLRIRGEIELTMLLNSFYEYCDVRMLLLNIFGGKDRIIYPRFFNSFIIIPDELVNFRYKNEFTGVDYKIDWNSAGAYQYLVKSINTNELVLPTSIKPQLSLTSIADGSTRYGGADRLADWRLTATVNYEVELPNYFIVFSNYLAQGFDFEIRYLSNFSEYDSTVPPTKMVPVDRIRDESRWDWGLDSTSNSEIVQPPPTPDFQSYGDLVLKTRYFHTVTAEEATDTTSNLEITIPEQILDVRKILVSSKYGLLDYGDHYVISQDGYTLIINTQSVKLEENQILELNVYEKLQQD